MLKGYVEIDPRHFGCQLQAVARARLLPGRLHKSNQASPEYCECGKVTGEGLIAGLQVRSMEKLDESLDRTSGYAETDTAIIRRHRWHGGCPDGMRIMIRCY